MDQTPFEESILESYCSLTQEPPSPKPTITNQRRRRIRKKRTRRAHGVDISDEREEILGEVINELFRLAYEAFDFHDVETDPNSNYQKIVYASSLRNDDIAGTDEIIDALKQKTSVRTIKQLLLILEDLLFGKTSFFFRAILSVSEHEHHAQ